eukprot:8188435-Pyramimonas_sp.AAC.1
MCILGDDVYTRRRCEYSETMCILGDCSRTSRQLLRRAYTTTVRGVGLDTDIRLSVSSSTDAFERSNSAFLFSTP